MSKGRSKKSTAAVEEPFVERGDADVVPDEAAAAAEGDDEMADMDEYYESSSEDFPAGVTRNTVGNVPMHWYDDYEHVGYDLEGKKILKSVRRDQIEEFLAKVERMRVASFSPSLSLICPHQTDNPNYWRTLYDEVNDREVVLTDAQLEILQRIQRGEVAEPEVRVNECRPRPLSDCFSHSSLTSTRI